LVWDASQDWKALLKEYSVKTFGPAAPEMERYYLRLAETQSRAGQEAGSYWSAPLIFDEAYMQAAQSDLDAAMKQPLSPEERARTQAATLPHEVLQHYLAWHNAMNNYDFPRAKTSFEALRAAWQKQLDLNGQFAAREVPSYTDRLMKVSTDEAVEYS